MDSIRSFPFGMACFQGLRSNIHNYKIHVKNKNPNIGPPVCMVLLRCQFLQKSCQKPTEKDCWENKTPLRVNMKTVWCHATVSLTPKNNKAQEYPIIVSLNSYYHRNPLPPEENFRLTTVAPACTFHHDCSNRQSQETNIKPPRI